MQLKDLKTKTKGSDVENDFRNCRPIEGRGGARDEVKNEELKIKLN